MIFKGFSSSLFFFYFLRLSHLLWFISMCCGDFCLISSYVFTTLFFLLFSFVSIFIFKEDNMFYIHFQRGSPQQWIRAKGSSKSFLTKAPTPPWHHWEQSTHFFHFFGFLYFHYIRRLHFYHFIRFTIFLYFYIVFFSCLIVFQINYNNEARRKTGAHFTLNSVAAVAA